MNDLVGRGVLAATIVCMGCTRGSPRSADTNAVRTGGDTALAPPPLGAHPPETRDTALWLHSEFSGHGVELSITTPDDRTIFTTTPLGQLTPAPVRPDTNPLEGRCDCPQGQLFAMHVPPGIATLQARGIEDGEITVNLEANSDRSNRTGYWQGAHATLKKGEIRRWSVRVPTSAHPESLTVTPSGEP
jgi:hypothetical protein